MSENKYSLICSTFTGTLNQLHLLYLSNPIIFQNGAPNLSRPYSRASYSGPSNGPAGYGYRPLVHGVNGGLYPSSAADLDDVVSIKSYPGAFVGHRSAARTTRRPLTALNGYGSHIGDYEVSTGNMVMVSLWAWLLCGVITQKYHQRLRISPSTRSIFNL